VARGVPFDRVCVSTFPKRVALILDTLMVTSVWSVGFCSLPLKVLGHHSIEFRSLPQGQSSSFAGHGGYGRQLLPYSYVGHTSAPFILSHSNEFCVVACGAWPSIFASPGNWYGFNKATLVPLWVAGFSFPTPHGPPPEGSNIKGQCPQRSMCPNPSPRLHISFLVHLNHFRSLLSIPTLKCAEETALSMTLPQSR